MSPITAIKRQLHRDIVRDPILHARVLNLYLCGEAYPHAVDDYFQTDYVECPELRGKMQSHFADEDKHVLLYAAAIRKLGAEVLELPPPAIFNHVIRSHTPDPWRAEPHHDADARADRIANFLAHAHFLEKRVARSLEFHLDACAHSPSPYPGKAVAAVLQDETRHVSYTLEAVHALLPKARADAVIATHRRAESQANLDFSSHNLRRLLREEKERWPGSRRALYRGCTAMMAGLLACA
jgi:hypothetical protein